MAKLSGAVLTAAFMVHRADHVAEVLVQFMIPKMSPEELDAFNYYLDHGSFIGMQ